MWSLATPARSTGGTFALCTGRIRDADLKARLQSVAPDVEAAAVSYQAAGLSGALETLPTADAVGTVTRDEMSDLYTFRLAKLGSPGRIVYDELIASAVNGRCPLCGQRQVASLDHFLPKAQYPAFAVTPLNLVPACSDCNKAKLDHAPATAVDVTLHPYFDDIEDDLWLVAEVVETAPAALTFAVVEPAGWDATLAGRVRHHFTTFQLSRLYSAEAAQELVNIRHHLDALHSAAGAKAVATHLSDMATSRECAHINSWQSASYRAWAESSWFCDGGFR